MLATPRLETGAKLAQLAQLAVLVLAASLSPLVAGYPSGAPEQACKELRPGHGHEPQTGPAPFQLSQDKAEAAAGDQIKVVLSSSDDTTFKGLMVQAVNDKDEPVGKFLAGKGLRAVASCSAVTHSDREPKKTATLIWEAPAEAKDKTPVGFKATVVHKFDTIYVDIKSKLAT